MADPTDRETAVRRYLQWLENPGSLVDPDQVRRAEQAVANAGDVMARLHALADLDHAKKADESKVVADFVAHAKAYADAQGIPASAFRDLGVPPSVLADAGLGGPRAKRGSTTRTPRTRNPQVSAEKLKDAALTMSGSFTLTEVTQKAGGGSQATVRKAVEGLVNEGRAARIGPKPDHDGPGRAPILYELR